MRTISNSYVSRVLFAVPAFAEPRRLRRLHHMRGPGPKWRKEPTYCTSNGMRPRDQNWSESAAD